VCLRSCQRMFGSPARFRSGLKYLFTTFCASRGVPLPVVNTSPLSCHLAPALSCSSSCRLRWSERFYSPLRKVYGPSGCVLRL